MGLDITVKECKDVFCPHCGCIVKSEDISSADSSGRKWYYFLENLGYYVPYEKRTAKNDWYGKDMVLNNNQAKQLADYATKEQVYNYEGVRNIVARALTYGNKIVINADW